jgi:hypothetical protein
LSAKYKDEMSSDLQIKFNDSDKENAMDDLYEEQENDESVVYSAKLDEILGTKTYNPDQNKDEKRWLRREYRNLINTTEGKLFISRNGASAQNKIVMNDISRSLYFSCFNFLNVMYIMYIILFVENRLEYLRPESEGLLQNIVRANILNKKGI